MHFSIRWALLLALIAVAVSSAVSPAAAFDDDCWGCAPGSCDRLTRPARGGRDADWDDRYYYSCRQCVAGYTLVNDDDDGVIYGECVCDAAQGFGLRNINGRRTCATCPANTVPISCASNLQLRFSTNTAANGVRRGQWQLRLGNATSCRDFDWDDFRPEWKPEFVPNSIRRSMRVPRATFREFQCVPCSAAGNARKSGNQCVAA